MRNRGRDHLETVGAKRVPVTVILLMFYLPKGVQANSILKWWYEARGVVVKLAATVLPFVMKCLSIEFPTSTPLVGYDLPVDRWVDACQSAIRSTAFCKSNRLGTRHIV
jgi:hypothetical protein